MATKTLLQWLKKDDFEYCVIRRDGLIKIVKSLIKKEKALNAIACDAGNNCSQCQIDMETARKALDKEDCRGDDTRCNHKCSTCIYLETTI